MCDYSKLFGCNIYGSIRVEPMALKIINTPEFQRMKQIKQLGLCYLVYPNAMHSRFEHLLGTYHLADSILERLKSQYPEKYFNVPELGGKVKLTKKIMECIKIAALCHDIGHGPFSHTFDLFLNNIKHPNKEHEVRSCLIMEMICKRELYNELSENEINFIKSLINPNKENVGALYQIVANNMNGIDVDKFDYLIRDSYNLGIKVSFDYRRLINEIILDCNDNITYPKHCSTDIYEMFHSRYLMHKKVYSHKTVIILEVMMMDIFLKIDMAFKISESIYDMKKFCELTDNTIFNYMELIVSPPKFVKITLNDEQINNIRDAYNIYYNIISRKLYKQIAEATIDITMEFKDFINFIKNKYPTISENDFEIKKVSIGYVNYNKIDPFDNIYFYDKKENNNSFKLNKSGFSGFINNKIHEIHIQLIYKNANNYHLVMEEFKKYLSINKIELF